MTFAGIVRVLRLYDDEFLNYICTVMTAFRNIPFCIVDDVQVLACNVNTILRYVRRRCDRDQQYSQMFYSAAYFERVTPFPPIFVLVQQYRHTFQPPQSINLTYIAYNSIK